MTEVHDDILHGSHVLVIDDEVNLVHSIKRRLQRHKIEVSEANSGAEGLEILGKEPIDVVLLDIKMPEMDGIEVLTQIKDKWPDIPVVMMTAYATVENAVQAMKKGAFDFMQKPFEPPEILSIMIAKAMQHRRLLQRYANLQREVEGRYCFNNIIGKSRLMQDIFRSIERISHSESTVLITGESGVGKELIARAIHYNSPRRKFPFVTADLGALTENVIESELFGHMKGSFTGAVNNHKGLFQVADGGAIFLDEIGEIPLKVQAKLLRVLQEREIKPVGSSYSVHINVRVIAATNKNLEELVKKELFREDLYYRLRVVPIEAPPLRDRRDDIPLLIQHFIEKHAGDRQKLQFSPSAIETFAAYNWPGNVRELENMIERLLALSNDIALIESKDLPSEVRSGSASSEKSEVSFDNYERMAIERALVETNGDLDQASVLLKIGKSTLYRRMKSLGLNNPKIYKKMMQ